MHRGAIVQTGTERELMDNPVADFVADFLAGHVGGET